MTSLTKAFHACLAVCLLGTLLLVFAPAASAQKRKKAVQRREIIANIYTTVDTDAPPKNATPEQKIRLETFVRIWETVRDNYFDTTFNGNDWNKVKVRFRPRVLAVQNDLEFNKLMYEMLNTLNRSHFAVIAPSAYQEINKARTESRAREKAMNKPQANAGIPDDNDEDEPLILTNESNYRFGIGVELRLIDKKLVISRVENDSAAAFAGVKAGYILDKINGVSMTDVMWRTLTFYSYIRNMERRLPREIVEWFLNGEKDTKVAITCLDGENRPVDFLISRERLKGELISIGPNFPRQFLDFEARSLTDDVGYIRFNLFAVPVMDRFCSAVRDFKNKKALVIDLRGNVGGVLGTINGLSGMLVDRKELMGTAIYRHGNEEVLAYPKANHFTGSLILLTDAYTLSSGEVFAAGLKENGRALLVGEPTGGEALPSLSLRLPDGGVLIYPAANFRTRDGNLIEGNGVKPDIAAVNDRAAMLAGHDVQLDTALAAIARGDTPQKPKVIPPPDAKVKTISGNAIQAADRDSPPRAKVTPSGGIREADPSPPRTLGSGSGSGSGQTTPFDPVARKLIDDFIAKIGGRSALAKLRSYSASGMDTVEIAGSLTEFGFKVFGNGEGKYLMLLSSETVGEARQVFDGKTLLLQTDFGLEETIPGITTIDNVDIFYIFKLINDPDAASGLVYYGRFDSPRMPNGKLDIMAVKLKAGGEVLLGFDPVSGMLLSYSQAAGLFDLSDYRNADGLLLPFRLKSGKVVDIALDEIKLDQKFDEAIFERKKYCFDDP